MKKLLIAFAFCTVGLTGCASKMPIEKYDGFAQEWATAATCYNTGLITPAEASDYKDAFGWVTSTWGAFDSTEMYARVLKFGNAQGTITETDCRNLMLLTQDRFKARERRNAAKAQQSLQNDVQPVNRTTSCLTQQMGNVATHTICN